MAESPASPLSSLASDDFNEDLKLEDGEQSPANSATPMHPSKRRRIGISTWDHHTPVSSINDDHPPASPTASISSDSSSGLPNSPTAMSILGADEDYSGMGRDQVTTCLWEGCEIGDLGHMDALVKHIHDAHIGSRQKKYLCEWSDCGRKGQSHASGYALRAHMRSHTKEKPFYCSLPECDRSFTRSDALTKHMRTVHETEALKTAEQVGGKQSRNASTLSTKTPRLKLKLQPRRETDDPEYLETKGEPKRAPEPSESPPFDVDLGLDEHEIALPLDRLARVLRRQIYWAEQESKRLEETWDIIKPQRKDAWREKELIFDDVINTELRVAEPGDGDGASSGVQGLLSLGPATGDLKKAATDIDEPLNVPGPSAEQGVSGESGAKPPPES
ncbi:hypothetical protein FQN57_005206 [Myotisia sp. PD_48]|nr:hypothetical protein FQN57_005206 [Myotisia sp. PD_48]